MSRSYGKLYGRLSDHTKDRHADGWDRFSFFSFDETDEDGVTHLDEDWTEYQTLDVDDVIEDFEAALIGLLPPPGNRRNMSFATAKMWEHVALTQPARVKTLDEYRQRLL